MHPRYTGHVGQRFSKAAAGIDLAGIALTELQKHDMYTMSYIINRPTLKIR